MANASRVVACAVLALLIAGLPVIGQAGSPTPLPGEPPGFQTLLNGLKYDDWRRATDIPPNQGANVPTVDRTDPTFAVTAAGRGYFVTTDGGRSWVNKHDPAGDPSYHSIAIWHRDGGPRWIYLAGSNGLWRTKDDGKTWDNLSGDEGNVFVLSNTVLFGSDRQLRRAVLPSENWRSYPVPADGPSLVEYEWSHGGQETILDVVNNPRVGSGPDQYHLFVKQDGGPFAQVGWSGSHSINQFFAIPGSATVFAAGDGLPDTGSPGGLWRSDDAGMTWNLVRTPAIRGRGFVSPGDPRANICCYPVNGLEGIRLGGTLVLFGFASGSGSLASYDGGSTWYLVEGARSNKDFYVELDGLTLVPHQNGLDFYALGQDGSVWRQSLPGLAVEPVFTLASDRDLEGSSWDIVTILIASAGLIAGTILLWLVIGRGWIKARRPAAHESKG